MADMEQKHNTEFLTIQEAGDREQAFERKNNTHTNCFERYRISTVNSERYRLSHGLCSSPEKQKLA